MRTFLSIILFLIISAVLMFSFSSEKTLPDIAGYQNDISLPDQGTHSREDLVRDFINLVFVDKRWPENRYYIQHGFPTPKQEITQAELEKDRREYIATRFGTGEKSVYPKKEFIFTDDFFPDLDRLHRWEAPKIYVTFVYPYSYDGQYYKGADLGNIQAGLEKSLPELSQATDIQLELRAVKDYYRDDVSYAPRIEIFYLQAIPQEQLQKNLFKRYKPTIFNIKEYQSAEDVEALLARAIAFTVGVRSQVDGFYLHRKNGEIGYAKCYISHDIPDALVMSLTNECIVRSLGLAGLSENENAVLGNWNKAFDDISKLVDLDGGPEALIDQRQTGYHKLGRQILASPEVQEKLQAVRDRLVPVSSYDLLMLRLLYCKEIPLEITKSGIAKKLPRSNCLK